MHVLLRPTAGRANARLCEGLPDAIDSLWRTGRATAGSASACDRVTRSRIQRCTNLRSNWIECRRQTRDLRDSRPAGGLQFPPCSRGTHDKYEVSLERSAVGGVSGLP